MCVCFVYLFLFFNVYDVCCLLLNVFVYCFMFVVYCFMFVFGPIDL